MRRPTEREQRLVDLVFEVGVRGVSKMEPDAAARRISVILRDLGFPTTPCGASWGILDKDDQK